MCLAILNSFEVIQAADRDPSGPFAISPAHRGEAVFVVTCRPPPSTVRLVDKSFVKDIITRRLVKVAPDAPNSERLGVLNFRDSL